MTIGPEPVAVHLGGVEIGDLTAIGDAPVDDRPREDRLVLADEQLTQRGSYAIGAHHDCRLHAL